MISLKLNLDDTELKRNIGEIIGRLEKPKQALKECGLVWLRSIGKNFKTGGRPMRWKTSKRAAATGGGKTLVDTAVLKNSITVKADETSLTAGTVVKSGAIHQLGGKINKNVKVNKFWRYMDTAFGKAIAPRHVLVSAHTRQMNLTMPKRPFLVVQDADWRVFQRIFEDYVTQ